MYPLTLFVAAGILITGVLPPDEMTGDVPVTLMTLPVPMLARTKAVVATVVLLVPTVCVVAVVLAGSADAALRLVAVAALPVVF
jgi:hypothetical protein